MVATPRQYRLCVCVRIFTYQQNLFVAFRVNMLQQIHLPVNSTSGKHEETPSKTFESI